MKKIENCFSTFLYNNIYFTVAILAQAIITMAKRYQRCQNKIHKKKHKKKIIDLQQKNRLLRQKVISAPQQLQDEYEHIVYGLYTTIELQELENRLLREQHDSDTLEQLEKDRKSAGQEKTISQLQNNLLLLPLKQNELQEWQDDLLLWSKQDTYNTDKQYLAQQQLRKQLRKYENVVQKLKIELLEKNMRIKLLELEN